MRRIALGAVPSNSSSLGQCSLEQCHLAVRRCAACDAGAGGLRHETSSPALGQQRASPVPRSPDSVLNDWDRRFVMLPQQIPSGASPSPNAAFPSFLRPQQPQQELPMEAVIICTGSKTAKTAANPFLPHEMAKGSTRSPPIRTAICSATALVSSPAAVAFLLTQELGVAHVSWTHTEGVLPPTSYTLRLE